MKRSIRRNVLIATMVALLASSVWATQWPNNSIYQTEALWQNQLNVSKHFADSTHPVRFVAFVYTHCVSMCPVIVADLKRIEQKLSANALKRTKFTMVSLDPEHDTPDVMAAFLKEHELSDARWEFLRAPDQDTRELALLMNIRYRQEGNEIAHSNAISLLDGNGVLMHQRQGTGGLDEIVAVAENLAK